MPFDIKSDIVPGLYFKDVLIFESSATVLFDCVLSTTPGLELK